MQLTETQNSAARKSLQRTSRVRALPTHITSTPEDAVLSQRAVDSVFSELFGEQAPPLSDQAPPQRALAQSLSASVTPPERPLAQSLSASTTPRRRSISSLYNNLVSVRAPCGAALLRFLFFLRLWRMRSWAATRAQRAARPPRRASWRANGHSRAFRRASIRRPTARWCSRRHERCCSHTRA